MDANEFEGKTPFELSDDMISKIIKLPKIVTNFYGVSYTIEEYSNPIDVAELIRKYNRVPRKITEERFLRCHLFSLILRLAIKALKDTNKESVDLVLIEQESFIPFPISNIFWTDRKAFMWYLEYAQKWIFRLGLRVKIGYR